MIRVLRAINRLEEYTVGMTLLAMALFACVQVFTRYVLNFSFSWFEELSRILGVFLTFLGAGLGIKYSTHFAMTAVVDRVPTRVRGLILMATWVLTAAFFVIVTYYGTRHCLKHYRFGGLTPTLRWPLYIQYLPIPFFSAIMAVRSLVQARAGLRLWLSGRGNVLLPTGEDRETSP